VTVAQAIEKATAVRAARFAREQQGALGRHAPRAPGYREHYKVAHERVARAVAVRTSAPRPIRSPFPQWGITRIIERRLLTDTTLCLAVPYKGYEPFLDSGVDMDVVADSHQVRWCCWLWECRDSL
jgi:hypothetical protein